MFKSVVKKVVLTVCMVIGIAMMFHRDVKADEITDIQVQQALLNVQYQQYKSMIQTMGLEYQPYLLDEYAKYQQNAITGFNGYNGVVY